MSSNAALGVPSQEPVVGRATYGFARRPRPVDGRRITAAWSRHWSTKWPIDLSVYQARAVGADETS